MKIACQERLLPGRDIKEKLVNLKKYGFEGVELSGEGLEKRKEEVKRACEEIGVIPCSICGGFLSSFVAGDRKVREESIDGFKKILRIGSEIGVRGVMIVPIFGPPQVQDLSPYKNPVEIEKELLLSILPDLAEYAKDLEVTIWIEPLNRYETHFINRLEQAMEICKEVNHPNLKMMADFFHMSIEEVDIAKSLREAGDWIDHIHLADSNRMLPGQGHLNFKPPFEALKNIGYDKYMALECSILGDPKEELPKSVNYLKEQIGG